jgi:hypothetical protein
LTSCASASRVRETYQQHAHPEAGFHVTGRGNFPL